MRKYLDKLIKVEGQAVHPLIHLFLLQTLITGLAFVFFGWTDTVQATILWQYTQFHFGDAVASLWGVGLILVTVANTICVYTRSIKWGKPVTMAGFALWFYAAVMYVATGFWFQFFVPAVINMAFWAWWYLTVSRFVRERTD